ncbi:hypothetical protein M601_021405 [Cellulophaga baltica 4]|nr:hypothetical protein M601_021405 [Cellulophaga baltica 4]
MAVQTKQGYKITDFAVAQEIEKVNKLLQETKNVDNIRSVNSIFKALNKANHLNKTAYFVLPDTQEEFDIYKKMLLDMRDNN